MLGVRVNDLCQGFRGLGLGLGLMGVGLRIRLGVGLVGQCVGGLGFRIRVHCLGLWGLGLRVIISCWHMCGGASWWDRLGLFRWTSITQVCNNNPGFVTVSPR